MIPSAQRATILSFDSLFSSAGGIVAQPALSRSADVGGYPVSYLFSAAGSALASAVPLAGPATRTIRPTPRPDRVGDSAAVAGEGGRRAGPMIAWVGCHVRDDLTH